MKLNKSKFIYCLDMLSFIVLSVVLTVYMLIGIAKEETTMQPSTAFAMVYLINLIFYRLCLESDNIYKSRNKYNTVYFLSMMYLLGVITTISLLVYLIYFACIKFHYCKIIDIFNDHVFYATLVGCLFTIFITIDNTNTLYNLYIKENK